MRTNLCDLLHSIKGEDTIDQIKEVAKYGREMFGMDYQGYYSVSL